MWRKLVGKTVYIRLAEQDNAFIATVRYGCLYRRLEAWLVERATGAGAYCVNPPSNNPRDINPHNINPHNINPHNINPHNNRREGGPQ